MDFRDVVCNLINENSYKRVAEIGVWKGELSSKIIKKCSPEYLLLVDPLSYELNNMGDYKCTMGEPVKTQSELDEIATELSYLSATFMRTTSIEAAQKIEDGSLDFVFIDAMHLYDYIVQDINTWLPKIRKGGMISGDDYIEPRHEKEVRRAIKDTIGSVENIGRVWFKKV